LLVSIANQHRPEILHQRNHSHLVLTGNLTFDLLAVQGRRRCATPFVVAAADCFRHAKRAHR
jgi:hypothetical protein